VRVAICWLTVFAGACASLPAKPGPDFSGVWLRELVVAGPDVPEAMSIKQSLVRTNIYGKPMKPFFRDITVTRSWGNVTGAESYNIGTLGGTISGQAGGELDSLRTHHRVAWQERALVFESGSYTGSAPETGNWTERREVWKLDSRGRLHVTLTTRSAGDVTREAAAVYRRQ